MLMPEGSLDFKLTNERAVDSAEASCRLLSSIRRENGWSRKITDLLELNYDLLPPLKLPAEFIGRVSSGASG